MDNKPRSGILYKGGYKYQLVNRVVFETGLKPNRVEGIWTSYIELTRDGKLTIKDGYAWNGANSPAINTDNLIVASLIHDVLYQLLEEYELQRSYKDEIDAIMLRICKDLGMNWFRRWYIAKVLKYLGHHTLNKPNIKKFIPYTKLIQKN